MFEMSSSMAAFTVRILEKLSADDGAVATVQEPLEEVRDFFDFGCCFVYTADHQEIFTLREHSQVYRGDHIRQVLPMRDLVGGEMLDALSASRSVVFSGTSDLDELEACMSGVFAAQSLILIPIRDQTAKLMALVGLADRRASQRKRTIDMEFAYSILASIANHIKLRLYQQRVELAQRSLESILDHTGIDIYVNDFQTHEVLYANETMAAPYGGVENMVGKICWQILYDDKDGPCEYCPQNKLIDEAGNPTKIYSWDYRRPFDGSWFRVLSGTFPWMDGRLAHIVSSVDITENKKNEETIRQLAEYDALTNLPNFRRLMMDCQRKICEGDERSGGGYVMFFDLDGFKAVNDDIGHRAGDELLVKIAEYIEDDPLTRGRCYRFGGDEFVLLAFDYDKQTALRCADALIARFRKPWVISSGEVFCHTSIGIAQVGKHSDAGDLIHDADMAMYAAKRAGKGQIRFSAGGVMLSRDACECE